MSSSNNSNTMQIPNHGRPDPASPHTTFVQADPSNFRAIVQKLTGAPEPHNLPLTLVPNLKPPSAAASSPSPASEMGARKPGFKLHERRQRKLDTIQLGKDHRHQYCHPGSFGGRSHHPLMVSPVSPLDLFARGSSSSPRTPSVLSPHEEEERAIAEKGFYLHPISPLGTPRGADPPELLPLFPLHSPRDRHQDSS